MPSISPSKNDNSGFTLLEVLISIIIMMAIAASIYQTTTKTYELRDKLMHESEFFNGIRTAMGIVDRDVSMIYSPILMLPEDPKQQGRLSSTPLTDQQLQEIQGNDQGRVSTRFWTEAIHKSGIRASRFQGADNKMSFISLSHLRIYRETQESEFARISYELQDDKSPGAESGSKVLVRQMSPNAFDDDETALNPRQKMNRTYNLLTGIKKFKLQYYRHDRKEWLNSWDTDGQDSKYRYPDIVKVEFEVVGPSRLQFSGTYLFKTEIPLRGITPSG